MVFLSTTGRWLWLQKKPAPPMHAGNEWEEPSCRHKRTN